MKAAGSIRHAVVCALVVGVFAFIRPAVTPLAASAASDGAATYAAKCSSCHKADGKGGGPFPALAGNKSVTAKDPSAIIAETLNGKGLMPGFKSQLSAADIAAVLTYVRTSWGNKAPAVTEAQVAAVH
ncbi:MAG TPA: cytochrome c [Candidatus Baltobacteraceae bacterium]|nr:cytochrome c [Candidatus Baltobacteraceae bacterium]